MMSKFGAAAILVTVVLLAGCASDAKPQAAETPSSAPTTTTSLAPSSTPTPEDVVADASCGLVLLDSTAVLLARSWERVTASRQAGDHEEMVKGFKEQVDDLFDDADDEPTQEAKAACGVLELAELNYELAVLNAGVVISGEADDEAYEKVADAANAWVEKVGLTDKLDPFTPTYTG